jgi:hypothetical protein
VALPEISATTALTPAEVASITTPATSSSSQKHEDAQPVAARQRQARRSARSGL